MGEPRVKINVSKWLSQSTVSEEIMKVAPPATLVVGIGTKVNILTMGIPSVKVKVYKWSSQSTATDEIIKVEPSATLVVIIGTK